MFQGIPIPRHHPHLFAKGSKSLRHIVFRELTEIGEKSRAI